MARVLSKLLSVLLVTHFVLAAHFPSFFSLLEAPFSADAVLDMKVAPWQITAPTGLSTVKQHPLSMVSNLMDHQGPDTRLIQHVDGMNQSLTKVGKGLDQAKLEPCLSKLLSKPPWNQFGFSRLGLLGTRSSSSNQWL